MAPKRAPIVASSKGNKGNRLKVARTSASKRKRLEVARTNANKGKTSEVTKTNARKWKTPVVDENIEVRKKATFDRATFITPKLAQRFNLHFSNSTVISSRNIDFSKLSYFQCDRLFTRMGWLPIVSVKEFLHPRHVKCFYCNMNFEEERPISTTVNGVQIKFDVAKLCKILDILNEGACLYEPKKRPRVDGFKPAKAV